VCLLLGAAFGAWWPTSGETHVWREGESGAGSARAGAPFTFADIIDAARPGIVTVRARMPAPAAELIAGEAGGEGDEPRSGPENRPGHGEAVLDSEPGFRNGSGFVVNAKGLIVTSRHVVAGAEVIDVIVPKHGKLRAVLVGEDKATDIAIVRLENPPADLHALPLGRSEKLRAGDWIVAVGNPYGFAQTVTAGVVSFVGRHLPHSDLAVTNDFVQISAPVNPGSSGCPVLDLHGRVVGVTTQAAVQAQGISFAVPSRTLKWTLDAMERSPNGSVQRGYLGIEFQSVVQVDADGNEHSGARIIRVVKDAPAFRAGLRSGDVVVSIDGRPVDDAMVLHEHIVRGQPGGHIALQVLRQGRLRDPIGAVLSEMGGAKVPSQSDQSDS